MKGGAMMEKLAGILKEIKSDVDYGKESRLFTDGILTSLDMVRLVLGINELFGIEIDPDDIITENFDSVPAMMKLIERYGGK